MLGIATAYFVLLTAPSVTGATSVLAVLLAEVAVRHAHVVLLHQQVTVESLVLLLQRLRLAIHQLVLSTVLCLTGAASVLAVSLVEAAVKHAHAV